MFDFKTISLSDKEWITGLLKLSDFRGCEYSFANNMAWYRLYDTKVCRFKDFYLSCSYKNGVSVTFPAGKGDYKELFTLLKDYAYQNDCNLVVTSVSHDNIKLFEEYFPDQFTVVSDEADFDYVYYAKDLIDLAGKKYHSKRNHLKKFCQLNWEYEALSDKNFDECINFAVESYNKNDRYDDESSVAEQFAINTFFNCFNELELKGGLIRVDGKLEGFTIGNATNSDTFDIHIEKANGAVDGAYAAINNEFAKAAASGYKYINREEDLGIEGLRKSKRSYYPAFLLEKNTVIFK